jgi:hypothetical protein
MGGTGLFQYWRELKGNVVGTDVGERGSTRATRRARASQGAKNSRFLSYVNLKTNEWLSTTVVLP